MGFMTNFGIGLGYEFIFVEHQNNTIGFIGSELPL